MDPQLIMKSVNDPLGPLHLTLSLQLLAHRPQGKHQAAVYFPLIKQLRISLRAKHYSL